MTFSLEVGESLANAIRRYVDQIPILAVDEVEISKNDSPLYDETVAHRIGMVPLKMDKTINEKSSEQLTLIAKNDGIIYSGDMKGRISPVYEKIPITILKKGQELEILATAKVGKGSQHVKYSPGLMFYRNSMKIKLDKDCSKEVVNVCPQGVFKVENGKISVDNEERCDMCEACTDFCKKTGKNSIELIPSEELIITVESFGQISEEEIFKKAIDVLKDDLSMVVKKLK
jgi:DNA-directed RNA polymerase subunit D